MDTLNYLKLIALELKRLFPSYTAFMYWLNVYELSESDKGFIFLWSNKNLFLKKEIIQ